MTATTTISARDAKTLTKLGMDWTNDGEAGKFWYDCGDGFFLLVCDCSQTCAAKGWTLHRFYTQDGQRYAQCGWFYPSFKQLLASFETV